jgi:hypothetical protein
VRWSTCHGAKAEVNKEGKLGEGRPSFGYPNPKTGQFRPVQGSAASVSASNESTYLRAEVASKLPENGIRAAKVRVKELGYASYVMSAELLSRIGALDLNTQSSSP